MGDVVTMFLNVIPLIGAAKLKLTWLDTHRNGWVLHGKSNFMPESSKNIRITALSVSFHQIYWYIYWSANVISYSVQRRDMSHILVYLYFQGPLFLTWINFDSIIYSSTRTYLYTCIYTFIYGDVLPCIPNTKYYLYASTRCKFPSGESSSPFSAHCVG